MLLSSFWGSTEMYMIILWIIIAVFSIILETESADLVSIWFALGAIGGIIGALLEQTILVQFLIFASVTLLFVIATRPLVKKLTKNTEVRTNADSMLEKIVEVTKEIPENGRGEVVVDYRVWTAIATGNQTFSVGDKVIIRKIEGNKLVVDSIQEIEIK